MNAVHSALKEQMHAMGTKARRAAQILATTPHAQRSHALNAMADAIQSASAEILTANTADLQALAPQDQSPAFADRLRLDRTRLDAIAQGLRDVAAMADPVGQELTAWTQPNGLRIARISVPLGVIGIIYESRPNVTADAGALCLKAANASILRGGSEALNTSREIHAAMLKGLVAADLPTEAIQLVMTPDREAVGALLSGLNGAVDLIIPRGGKSLTARVQTEARVPVLAHLDGNNHVYVDRSADPDMAKAITLNAKMRRVSVCGAAETLLIDQAAPDELKIALVRALLDAGCQVRADAPTQPLDTRTTPASIADWSTEYLAPIIAVKQVQGVAGAIAHIHAHSSHHTDAIIAADQKTAEQFLTAVDSAIVLWNASTQFADGAEFGMGAEIGISTGRLHARGPVGAQQLTTYKYVVRGHGHTRP